MRSVGYTLFVIGTSARGGAYTSRWKLVLSEYNSIRLRLFNSQALLEGTKLMLFNINEGVLVISISFVSSVFYIVYFRYNGLRTTPGGMR